MRLSLALLLTAPSLLAFANIDTRRSRVAHHKHARNVTQARGNSAYKLVERYQGEDFLNKFDYFSHKDPTEGSVNYLTKQKAIEKNLSYVQDDGVYVLAVDDTNWLELGQNRDSVRIQSQRTFNSGLFIADIWKMPHGCSTWPAYWMVGPDWPAGGEIDILEGVHEETHNQYTLHTVEGCTLDQTNPDGSKFTGRVINAQCASSPASNTGCAIVSEDQRTYGTGFNMIGGGAVVHLWNDDGISFWQFARGEIPQDITDGNPDPSSWPTPAAHFSRSSCEFNKFFRDNRIVINTTLCGSFGGATYSQRGCPGTCAEAIRDPANFKWAKWKFASISVYDIDN